MKKRAKFVLNNFSDNVSLQRCLGQINVILLPHDSVYINLYYKCIYVKMWKKTNVLRVLLNISLCTSSEFGRRNVCLWGLTSLTQKGCLNKKWSDFSSFRIMFVKISLQVRKQQNNTCNNSWLGCCSSSMNHRNMAWQN